MQKALYGAVAILRDRCPKCGEMAFVFHGKTACCEAPVVMPPEVMPKRMSGMHGPRNLVSAALRKRIRDAQHNRCIYCGVDLDGWEWNERRQQYAKVQVQYDHFVPYSYEQASEPPNIVAACRRCNGIKSNLMFKTLKEAIVYVQTKRNMV